MQKRQLYVSLEMADNEIRLLVGEFFMSRFNVIKVESAKCNGIQNRRIVKPQVVTATIIKLINSVEEALGFKIKNVILCIPSVDVEGVKRRVNVKIEEGARRIMKSHIRMGLEKAIALGTKEQYEFVNLGSVKYIISGISSRTMPLDERAEMLTMDIDLLYADKETVYSYVMCVEKTGLQILDICLDSYAMAEESAVIESSMDKYIVLVDYQREDTVLSLYYKGRLIECASMGYGYDVLIKKLRHTYRLSEEESETIVLENCFCEEGVYDDCVSYIWMAQERAHQITKKEVYECVREEMYAWIAEINTLCDSVRNVGNCKLVLSGEGADMIGISSLLDRFTVSAELYIPNSIGARQGKYSSLLGSLYCVKKWQTLNKEETVSIEYTNMIAREHHREDENAFTKKLKNILLMNNK